MFNKLSQLDVFRYSGITGISVSVIGMFIALIVTQLGEVTGIFSYEKSDLEVYNIGWFSIIIIAPIIESFIVILLIYLTNLFSSNEKTVMIVALIFSLLHGLSNWITALAVLPLFAISVISFFLYKKRKLAEGFLVVYLIHFINNSFILFVEFTFQI